MNSEETIYAWLGKVPKLTWSACLRDSFSIWVFRKTFKRQICGYGSSVCIDMFEITCPVFVDHWVVISKSVLPTTAGALKLRFSRTGLRPQLGLRHRKEFWGKDFQNMTFVCEHMFWWRLVVELTHVLGQKRNDNLISLYFSPFFIWRIGRSLTRRPSNLNLWAALPWLALAWCKETHSPKDFQTVAFV